MSEQPTGGHFVECVAQESVGESLAEQARAVPPGTDKERGLTDTGPAPRRRSRRAAAVTRRLTAPATTRPTNRTGDPNLRSIGIGVPRAVPGGRRRTARGTPKRVLVALGSPVRFRTRPGGGASPPYGREGRLPPQRAEDDPGSARQ